MFPSLQFNSEQMLNFTLRPFQLAALALALLTVAIRLPSLLHPQPIDDEAAYSVVANEIVDGGKPYIDAVDRKPPLLFWVYAAVFQVAGKYNWWALHAVALLWTLFTMAGLYVIGRRLFGRQTGLIAALLYSVFQPWATFRNLAFNGELLMNLPIVWAYAIAFRRTTSRWRPELFASGALLAAGFLLKQPAAIAAVPLGIYLLLPSYRVSRGLPKTAFITQTLMLAMGGGAALALVIIILSDQRIFREAIYWTIVDHSIPHVFWTLGVLITLAFIGACLPLVIGATLATTNYGDLWAGKKAEWFTILGLFAASAIGAAAGARFYPHYYIQLIPPLALLAAPHYAQLWSGRMRPRHWLLRPAVTYAWLALTVVGFSLSHWLDRTSPRQPSETGKYLLKHSAPENRIFIWGQAPRLYLHSQRRPACRYITTFPLTGNVFGGSLPGLDTRNRIVPGAWSMLQQDFARHSPAYIVDLYSDPNARYPVRDFPILARLLAEHYDPVTRTAEGVIYQKRETGNN